MGNIAQRIYKWDESGELATTYGSITDAVRGERTAWKNITLAIHENRPFKGFYFTNEPRVPKRNKGSKNSLKTAVIDDPVLEPWEGKDGMFDINGWAKVMNMQGKAEDMKVRPSGREWRFPVRRKPGRR